MQVSSSHEPDSARPQAAHVLFVDLDGTLLKTDLLAESVLELVKSAPAKALQIPLWLLAGPAGFKQRVADCDPPTAEPLPLRSEVVDLIARRRAEGWKIVLSTAQNERPARAVADALGLFDDVLASSAELNNKGAAKAAAIREYCRREGLQTYEYVGDGRADLPAWRGAATAYVVEPSAPLLAQVRGSNRQVEVVAPRRSTARAWRRAMRVHQWAKNGLLFLPVLLAHLHVIEVWARVALAFAAFCATASAIYLVNDLFDLASDRRHATKRRRPFAAGDLSIAAGAAASLGLMLAAFVIAAPISPAFVATLAIYVLANFLYTLWLKKKLVVDVLVLAGLYTLRIIAGGIAAEVEVSEWLRAFSLFFFASLAFLKRYIELIALQRAGEERTRGRGYRTTDLPSIQSFGVACGYLAVMVMSLYITSEKVRTMYRRPDVLWIVCPLLLYWISRAWIWANRGTIDEDPVTFALQDRTSWLILLATLATVALAV
jgi:4-hydroxybenzoate polyprenyltransferase/phosphoglycolate phosphatase-like HAD superfamily hydrolase